MSMPPERFWNSWDADRPALMRFLPLGLDLIPLAYAASRNSLAEFRGTSGVKLGPRSLDAARVALDLDHAGTKLGWQWRAHDPFVLEGSWQAGRMGEWGLRFWVILAVRAEPEVTFRYDPGTSTLIAAFGHRHLCLLAERPPLLVTAHAGLEELRAEYEREGYFFLGSRSGSGGFMALRFNLEEVPEQRFVAAFADDPGLALARARRALAEPSPEITLPSQTGEGASALDAVRDVMAWNHVWDPVNRRPYTGLSRNWASAKFGGFGVWLNDVLYHALMASALDVGMARESLAAVLAGSTPQGNLPCLLTGRDAWVDRTQPPIGAFILYLIHLRTGSRDLLEQAYPSLQSNHAWWWRERDPEAAGLVAYGTSDVGQGLYKGTKLAAKDESAMDNSPVHDELRLDPATGTLDGWDVGLNALLCLDAEMLGRIAGVLGEGEAAERYAAAAAAHRGRIGERLWDAERRVFANRKKAGGFVRSIAPTSFFPLLCAAASPDQARALVEEWLTPEHRFGGAFRLPSVTRDDPAYGDNVYWRGRIWPPLNFLTWHGLRRAGFDAEASALARDGHALFMQSWQDRICPENASAETGQALDQPDTDGFYGWGALWPYLAVADRLDCTPWGGLEIRAGGADTSLGPVVTPWGRARLEVSAGVTILSLAGRPALRTNLAGRLRHLAFEPGRIAMLLPGGPGWLELPGLDPARIVLARLGEDPIETGSARIELPADLQPGAQLSLWLLPESTA